MTLSSTNHQARKLDVIINSFPSALTFMLVKLLLVFKQQKPGSTNLSLKGNLLTHRTERSSRRPSLGNSSKSNNLVKSLFSPLPLRPPPPPPPAFSLSLSFPPPSPSPPHPPPLSGLCFSRREVRWGFYTGRRGENTMEIKAADHYILIFSWLQSCQLYLLNSS